jgi:V/A-type H+-transporting ATPase subunit F
MHDDRTKIGVVGDKDSVLCFKALGLNVFTVAEGDSENTRKLIDRLARDYGVIFITEQAAESVMETIDRYKNEILPAIILIPGGKGSLGTGLARVAQNVERAVGINILDEGR